MKHKIGKFLRIVVGLYLLVGILVAFQNCGQFAADESRVPASSVSSFIPEKTYLIADEVVSGSDDRIRLQSVIDKAVLSGTSAEIVLEPRAYLLNCVALPHKYCLEITNGRKIRIRGSAGQTRLIVTTPRSGFLRVLNSSEIEFIGFTVDYETPPFTQGKVVSVSGSSFVFEPDAGYPRPDSELLTQDLNGGPGQVGVGFVFSGNRSTFKEVTPDFLPIAALPVPAGTSLWRVETGWSHLPGLLSVGEVFAYGPRSSYGLLFEASNNLVIRNVNVHTAPSLAFAFVGNAGSIEMDQVRIVRSPGSNRLLSSVADAIHLQNNEGSFTLTNSEFEGMGDDVLNTYTVGLRVRSRINLDANQIRIERPSSGRIKMGHVIQVTAADKRAVRFPLGEEPTVQSVVENGADLILTLNKAMNGVQADDVVFDMDLATPRLRIANNRFGRFRGILRVRARQAEFSANSFDAPQNARILHSIATAWNEGPIVRPPASSFDVVSGGALQFLGLDYQVGAEPVGSQPVSVVVTPPIAGIDLAQSFNADFYVRKHADLMSFSPAEAQTHWLNHGRSECREGSAVFSPREYLRIYEDLRIAFGDSCLESASHFEQHAGREGRVGRFALTAGLFDAAYYKNRYSDLAHFDGPQLVEHWVLHGVREGRQGSSQINLANYKNRYPDLQTLFVAGGYQALLEHWVLHGKREGRDAR